jgi:CHAD domain-containing protein
MKEDEIIAILDRRIKKVKKEYHRLEDHYDEEPLHDYRAEMKKLKAFIRLLNINRSPGKKIRIGKKMKDVYRLSGDVRNLQLHQQRIKDIVEKRSLDHPGSYMKFLDEEKTNAAEHLKSATKKLSFHQFSKNIFDGKPFRIDDHDINRYFVQQLNILAILLVEPSLSDENLHEARKILKDIGYNRSYLSEALPLTIPALISDPDQTDNMTQKLGAFHDVCVSLAFLEPYYVRHIALKFEQEVLGQVKREIIQSHQKLKGKLVASLVDPGERIRVDA